MESGCCAVILAGGKSRRMGCPKPYLDFEGKTFVEKIISVYKTAGVENISVVLNRNYILPIWKKLLTHLKKEVNIIVNENNIEGRFHSVKLGLGSLDKMNYCFIQNVDNPFVRTDLLHELYRNRNPNGYTVPIYEGKGGHPVLLSKSIAENILRIETVDISLREILSDFNRYDVSVNDPSILLNINTPDDYVKHKLTNGHFHH